ncbi:50S ribosomal protein-like protein [Hirschfeldia incana]|nr:50S ribosomal protein-like protein [Hirschfeldia incana]
MSLSRLHKFKLFAANRSLDASAASNPSMSPTKSPVFHLQRRKTLRMLFEKSSDSRRRNLRQILEDSPELDGKKKRGNHRGRRKLKELMVTSPSPPFSGGEEIDDGGEARGGISSVTGGDVTSNGDGRELMTRRFGPSGPVQSFRLRILRKPWRPVLVSIPEQ